MGQLVFRVLLFVTIVLNARADDGWRRVLEPAVKDSRTKQNDPGIRISFNAEDKAVPPPWLVPPQSRHLGFPIDGPRITSFFDEEPSEFMPWPQKAPQARSSPQQSQHQPNQQPSHDLSSFLQPPPPAVSRQDPSPHQSYQQPLNRPSDQRQVPNYQPRPLFASAPTATLPPSVGELRNFPSSLLTNERYEDPFKPSQSIPNGSSVVAEPKKQLPISTKPTAASPIAQNTPLGADRRKSVRPVYDSSEYDYDDVEVASAVAAGHDNMPANARESGTGLPEDKQDDFFDHQQKRPQSAPKDRSKNRQPVPEERDFDQFDPEEPIFRTQVSSMKRFRPTQPPRLHYDDSDEDAGFRQEDKYRPAFVDEVPENRPAATKQNKGQSSAGRKQQVPQPAQQSGRDRSPAEPPRFETERPHFKSDGKQRQQPAALPSDVDWPYRTSPSGGRKSKPKPPAPTEYDEPLEHADFEYGKTKSNNNAAGSQSAFFSPGGLSDSEVSNHQQREQTRRPGSHRNQPDKQASKSAPSEFGYDPSFDQSAGDGTSRYQQRNPPQGNSGRRVKPKQSPTAFHSSAPAGEQPVDSQQGYPEFRQPQSDSGIQHGQRRPSGRRTTTPLPPVKPEHDISESDFPDYTDDKPFEPFVAPAPRPKRPQNSQAPKDGSLAIKGLHTLKTLAALQSPEAPRQPSQKAQDPFQEVKVSSPKPLSKRPSPSRYQPPAHVPDLGFDSKPPPDFDNEPKLNIDKFPSGNDPIPFGFFNAQEKESVADGSDESLRKGDEGADSDETFFPSTSKPFGRTSTTAAPAIHTTAEAEEKKPSTLFPPFNKRVRPTLPSSTSQSATEKIDNKAAPNVKEPAPLVPRITSYKQRIEAMKERVRLQQQQQQPAQSKKDDDAGSDGVDTTSTTTTTTTTTRKPPTTRSKFPPRMPSIKKPVTLASTSSSTTESAPVEEKETKQLPSWDETRRRFKPKSSYGRRPENKEETSEPDSRSDVIEDGEKKDFFPKQAEHPYRRNQQQAKKQQPEGQADESKEADDSQIQAKVPNKDPGKRRPSFSRTTSRPLPESEEEETGSSSWSPAKSPFKTAELKQDPPSEDEPTIELVEVTDGGHQNPTDSKLTETTQDEPATFQVPDYSAPSQEPFVEKPARSDEEVDASVDGSETPSSRSSLPLFTMATNDPMLPIEELLNIRIRDDGKGM